jgi:hypothetical protein
MTKFLVLYTSSVPATEMMAAASPEQAQAGMEAWMAWANKNGDSIVDLGMPLGPNMHVTAGSSEPGSSQVTGFSIVEADSLEQATKMLEDHPHHSAPGAAIDVLEFLPMPGA